MTRSISLCRPITGSSSPFRANSVRSRPNARSAGVLTSFFRRLAFLFGFGRREVWIEFLQDFVARAFDIDFKTLQHSGGDPLAFAQQPEQNVLRADVGMVERLRFLAGERKHFFDPRRVGNVTDHLWSPVRNRPASRLPSAPSRDRGPSFARTFTATPWPSLISPRSKMLGADVVVVEPVGFLASKRQEPVERAE